MVGIVVCLNVKKNKQLMKGWLDGSMSEGIKMLGPFHISDRLGALHEEEDDEVVPKED